MSRIFLSYSSRDKTTAVDFAEALRSLGHELVIDVDSLVAGDDWRDILMDGLQNADGLVILVTESSLNSPFVLSELGAARAFARASKDSFIVPVVLDGISIPAVIQDLLVVQGKSSDLKEIAVKVDAAIASHVGRQQGIRKREEQRQQEIVGTAAEFVGPHKKLMEERKRRERMIAFRWAVLGFALLLLAFWIAYCNFVVSINSIELTGQQYFVLGLRGVFAVGILIYGAKTAFTFSRANSREAVRSSDRVYASSFGEFFLQIFGTSASTEDVKDIFLMRHVDSDSKASGKTDVKDEDLDPKTVSSVTELLKTIGNLRP